jgi:hypothetical protein
VSRYLDGGRSGTGFLPVAVRAERHKVVQVVRVAALEQRDKLVRLKLPCAAAAPAAVAVARLRGLARSFLNRALLRARRCGFTFAR